MSETATIYCRISLDRTGESLGVQRQERECRELAARHGWEVDRVLIDNDISATSGKTRPAFEELLASSPERIVTWHTDRLMRVSSDLERVLDLKVNVYTVSAGWLDLSTPAGRAVARTITAWATYEGEQKAVRQKASHAQRRAQGRPWWTVAPFGYTRDGVPVEGEAGAIRKACADVLHGKAVAQIAREWAQQGFRSPRGAVMKAGTVRQVLIHPRNAGIMTEGHVDRVREIGQGSWEPIIDELTLRAVRSRLGDPSRRYGGGAHGAALLTGLLWCAVCDSRLGSHTQHQQGKVYAYYTCRNGGHVNWDKEWLEEHVVSVVQATLSQPQWAQGWVGKASDTSGLQAEVQRLRTLLDELMEERLAGRLPTAQYWSSAEKIQARLEELDAQLQGAAAVDNVALHDAAQRAQRWDSLDTTERREVIRILFPRIVLDRPKSGRGKAPDPLAINWS